MAIDHEVRLARILCARSFCDDDGMSGGFGNFCFKADGAAMFREPFGAGEQILFMLRLRGDAGEAEQFAQLGDEAGLVLFQIIKDDLHGA